MTDKQTDEDFSFWESILLQLEWVALRWGWIPPTLLLAWWACGPEDWRFYAMCLVGLMHNHAATKAGWCLAFASMDDDGEEEEEEVFYDL